MKYALGASSIALGVLAYGIYIRKTVREGGIEPHPFSWLLWAVVTAVAYFVQKGNGGSAGSWVTGFTAVVCLMIGLLTLFKNEWKFSRFDWFCIVAGIFVAGIYLTGHYIAGFQFGGYYFAIGSPVWSAVGATIADVVGYGPTLKKGWTEPHKDNATAFAFNSAKFLVALFALESYSIATWLYPLTIGVANAGVSVMLFWRGRRNRSPNVARIEV